MFQRYKQYRKISSGKATVILLAVAFLAVLVTWGIWSLVDVVSESAIEEDSFDDIIMKAGRRNDVDPELIRAVIWRESKFNRHTIGKDGEIGLMQIRQETAVVDWAREMKCPVPSKGALANPELNIEVGSWYLGRAMRRWAGYKDQVALALCEYNAGLTNAKKWKPPRKEDSMIGNISFPSTKEYVGDILRKYAENLQEAAKKREESGAKKRKE